MRGIDKIPRLFARSKSSRRGLKLPARRFSLGNWSRYIKSPSLLLAPNALRRMSSGFLALVLLVSMMPMAILIGMFSSNEALAFSSSQGPNYATSSGNCVEDTSYGNSAWNNPGNAYRMDDVKAQVSVNYSNISYYLKCQNFGFSIPTGATINGIELAVDRSASTASRAYDSRIRMVKGGTIQTHDKAATTRWTTSDVLTTYGSSSDLWGTTWTAANVNASTFGVALSVQASAVVTARVDSMSLTVHYTVPDPTLQQSSYRWFENQDTSGGSSFVKALAISSYDQGHDVVSTSDGGYAVAAISDIFMDLTVVKYSSNGTVQWVQAYQLATAASTPPAPIATLSIIQSSDGGYAIVGSTDEYGAGSSDMFLLKLTSSGARSWMRTLGDTGDDFASSLVQTSDGGFAIAGEDRSNNRLILAKYNSSGTLSWQRYINGLGYVKGLVEADDGGLVTAGMAISGSYPIVISKFNSSGTLQWSRSWVDATTYVFPSEVILASDGGFVISAVSGYLYTRAVLLKYSSSGVFEWSTGFGNSMQMNTTTSVIQAADGGFVVAGTSVHYGAGNYDAVLVRFSSSGSLEWAKTLGGLGADYALGLSLASDDGYIMTGTTDSFGSGGNNIILAKYDSSGNISGCSSPTCQSPSIPAYSPSNTTASPSMTSGASSLTGGSASPSYSTASGTDTTVAAYSLPAIDVGSPLNGVAQNTATYTPENSEIFRLRMNLHVVTNSAPGGGIFNYKLQYAARGGDGVCDTSFSGESYADVTTSTPISYANNPVATDGIALATNANDPTHSGHVLVRQEYRESNNFSVVNAISNGRDGMWDFALKDNNAPAGTTYCLRAVTDTGATLASYSVIPEITVPEPDFIQENYRWYNGQDAVPNNTFVQTWGGTGDDKGEAVTQTSDGGYAVAGSTTSYGSGQQDCFVAKYDATGDLQWSRTWGGSLDDYCRDIIQTKDGGLVATGKALSFSNPFADHFLVKYDISGNLLWLRTKGGLTDAGRVVEDKDGNLLITGYDWRGDNPDMFLTKFTGGGDVIWTRMWGGDANDYGNGLALANDGGYLVSGHSNSFTGSDDIVLVKYSADGDFEWSRLHGNASGYDWGSGVVQLPNGTIVVTGQTASYGVVNIEVPIILYDANGTLLSTQTLGGSGSERANDITVTNDGGFAIVGYSDTYVAAGGSGDHDILIAKYDSSATLEWTQTWGSGGNDYDEARSIAQTSDGGYVVTGETNSLGAGGADVVLLKLDSEGKIIGCSSANCTSPSPTVQSHTPTNSTPSGTATSPNHAYTTRTPSTSSPSASVSHLFGHMTFAKTWGDISNDYSYSMKQTSDQGYVVTGQTTSYGAGSSDVYLAKYDARGELSWSRILGGALIDAAFSVIQTSDGGYALAGQTNSYTAGGNDVFVAKYNSSGTFQWMRTWGGTLSDIAYALTETSDGGLAVAGQTISFGAGAEDVFLIKYNSSGTLQWSRTWGGTGLDYAYEVIETSDNSLVLTGRTASYGAGGEDAFLIKYNSSGTLQWSRTWGSTGEDYGRDVIQLDDGGYAITGNTAYGSGAGDIFVARYDSSGALLWSRTWGGAQTEYGRSIVQTPDGGITVAGATSSYGAGGFDVALAKFDIVGTLEWSRTWGDTGLETSYSHVNTTDGGIAIGAYSSTHGAGNYDSVLLKMGEAGEISGCSTPMCQSPTASTTSPTASTSSPTASTSSPTPTTSSPTPTTSSPTVPSTFVVNLAPWTDLAPIPSRALAAQDTAASGERHDDPLRLRVGLEATGKAAPAQAASLKLQVSPRVGTCDVSFTGESYVDIASSNVFGYYNNTNLADGDWARPGAQELTTSGAKLYQSYQESANFTNRHYIPTGTTGIWDIALTTTDNAPYNSYCFRVVNSDNSTLAEYSRVFELTIPPAASQQMRHGKFFSEATTSGTSDSRQPFYW